MSLKLTSMLIFLDSGSYLFMSLSIMYLMYINQIVIISFAFTTIYYPFENTYIYAICKILFVIQIMNLSNI